MQYTINRKGNIFTIINSDSVPLHLSVYVSHTCNRSENFEVIHSDITVFGGQEYSVTLPSAEGLYKLILTDRTSSEEIFVPQYSVFLHSLVEDIDYVLCGCSCSECEEDDTDILSVLLKILSYNTINIGKYERALSSSSSCISCDILEINRCNLLREGITGNVENRGLLKKLIAYYYLVFYNVDLFISKNKSETDKLYHYSKIYPCVKKYISDPSCIYLNSLPTAVSSNSSDCSSQISFIQNELQNKQDTLLEELVIDYWISSGDVSQLPVNIPSGKIAYVGGMLYEFIRHSMTNFSWVLYGEHSGRPSAHIIYVSDTGRYVWNTFTVQIRYKNSNNIS